MTALFEHRRTPEHRVVVSRADACWVGVDPSTRALALAAVLPDGRREVAYKPLAALRGAQRLSHAYDTARALAARLSGPWGPLGVILVEKPLHTSIELQLLCGAVQAGLYAGACGVMESCVVEVEAARWKRVATGYGGHRKPKREKGGPPVDPMAYGILAWARAAPWQYAGESWDVADACGIAEAAYQLYDLVLSA